MENKNSGSVRALTAMFSEQNNPIMGVKSAATKPEESTVKKPLPRGPKPPILSQKPVIPKPTPRKPPRQKSLSALNAVDKKDETTLVMKLNENDAENTSPANKCQSFDSLNTVYTSDSGISSTAADKSVPVNNELYGLKDINDNCSGKNAFVEQLEHCLGSQMSLKSSNESLQNENETYPVYRRVNLAELAFNNVPPRKPMLPPDVHIAVFKNVGESPPPAPPRRLSKPSIDVVDSNEPDSSSPSDQKQRQNSGSSYVRPLRIVPSRPSPPPPVMPKISLPVNINNQVILRSTDANSPQSDPNKRVSLIPEYTEDEEISDNIIYDDTSLNSENPPPLPTKPIPRANTQDLDNGIGNTSSWYQTPIAHVLPRDHPSNTNHYSIPRDSWIVSKEDRVRMRKEQKDKEKKEKEAAKIRKKYSLTGEEKVLDHGVIKESSKGRKTELAVRKGEKVVIIRMENNPSGMWLVQNSLGKLGYVDLTNIQVEPDSVKSVMLSGSPGADNNAIEEDTYADIEANYSHDAIYEETC